MARAPSAIPLNVITGFLGSGKTTLLQRLLLSKAFADTAVLVNEFGEVGLDHHLLRRIDDDVVLLQSGCLCCTIRGDLSLAIRDLYARRESGELPPFRRLVIETTGLADPVPVLATAFALYVASSSTPDNGSVIETPTNGVEEVLATVIV